MATIGRLVAPDRPQRPYHVAFDRVNLFVRLAAAGLQAPYMEAPAVELAGLGHFSSPRQVNQDVDTAPLSADADPALDNVRAILARDDLSPEYRAFLEKIVADSGPLRQKHAAMRAAALKKAAQP
jgi:hypothetical protein